MHPNPGTNGTGGSNRGRRKGQKHDSERSQALLPMMTSHRAPEASGYQHRKRVGSYMIGQLLGEGSFAKVREALHIIVGEKVAVKIIDKKVARMDFYIHKHLRREAAILQQLRHPNIVTLLEILETGNNLYLVLEICSGGPLLDLIWAQQGLTEEMSRRFTKQVVSAVQHLHNMGVMHRDLKVENLLLDDDQNIKLIDFGLSSYHIPTCEAQPHIATRSASSIYDRNVAATLCGSPAYAAPEIIAQKSYGPKVDVWSIGVNTFAMLTATLPFLVEPFNIRLLLRKMLAGEMTELPGNISTDCEDFVRRLLQPDPSCRPNIHQAANHPWLANATTSTQPRGRTSLTEIEQDVIYEIRETVGIDPSTVIDSLLGRRADEFGALYSLMVARRRRQWRTDMCDVKSSFDKLNVDLEGDDDDETSAQAILDCMDRLRETHERSHVSLNSQRSVESHERGKKTKDDQGKNYRQIYHDVLYEDDEESTQASNSQRKLRMEARKISEMCQRSNATSVASGNPWVGLMGREKSFLGETAVYKPELVESFKVNEKRQFRTRKPRERGAGGVKTSVNQVRSQKRAPTKRPEVQVGHVAPVYAKRNGTEMKLSTLGFEKTLPRHGKGKTLPSGHNHSMDSIGWNDYVLKSKSRTSIAKRGAMSTKRSQPGGYDLNGRPSGSNEVALVTGQKKTKQKQKAVQKRKINKKVENAISRLYGTSRRTSLAILQNRSKDKQGTKTEDGNIHQVMDGGVQRITAKTDDTGKLTKRTKAGKTMLKKGKKKSTTRKETVKSLTDDGPRDAEIIVALPDVN